MVNDLAYELIQKLGQRHLTISVAESLTGGLVAASLTQIPGASAVFKGGIIAYGDEIKQQVLKVDPALITKFTSISEPVAQSMATNVREIMNTDIGIATTGVAGPDKSDGFAPGIVFVAISIGDHKICQKLELVGDRTQIRDQSVNEIFKLTLSQLV
ncbi:MAG: CinA family protein [Candidatus Nanopelagicales bacterium]|nr:CinA family protein [Candidatus Nanopelagicales bacterium]